MKKERADEELRLLFWVLSALLGERCITPTSAGEITRSRRKEWHDQLDYSARDRDAIRQMIKILGQLGEVGEGWD